MDSGPGGRANARCVACQPSCGADRRKWRHSLARCGGSNGIRQQPLYRSRSVTQQPMLKTTSKIKLLTCQFCSNRHSGVVAINHALSTRQQSLQSDLLWWLDCRCCVGLVRLRTPVFPIQRARANTPHACSADSGWRGTRCNQSQQLGRRRPKHATRPRRRCPGQWRPHGIRALGLSAALCYKVALSKQCWH